MSTRNLAGGHSKSKWVQTILFALYAVFLVAPFTPTVAGAQSYAPAASGGYGMMGGGWMMGRGGAEVEQQLTFSESQRFLDQSAASARVDKARKEVIFPGSRVFIAMAAVQPGFPDTTFEVADLVDPTIEVPAGATVKLLLINMDYGRDMNHGVVITDAAPPYPVLTMMGMPGSLTGVTVLPPRDRSDANAAHYSAELVTFTAPESGGTYYYLCQYRDHASEGMFGRFIVK